MLSEMSQGLGTHDLSRKCSPRKPGRRRGKQEGRGEGGKQRCGHMASGKVYPWPDPLGWYYVRGERRAPVGEEELGGAPALTPTQTKSKTVDLMALIIAKSHCQFIQPFD